jgi:hypothetical protein
MRLGRLQHEKVARTGGRGRSAHYASRMLALTVATCLAFADVANGQAQSADNAPVFTNHDDGGFISSFSPSFSASQGDAAANPTATAGLWTSAAETSGTGIAPPACGDNSCATGDFQRALCEECPKWGIQTFVGYDTFRGISDDSWQNNGIHVGGNLGTWLGPLSEATGVGFQVGGSVGVYDWSGTDYRPRQGAVETQGFLTYGFFRKSNESSHWNAGVVQDWMFNNNFGEYSQNPTLSQIRAQLGYAFSPSNEIGLWGACRVFSDSAFVNGVGQTTWRSIDQLNLYWHHKWQLAGADTSIWIGIPEQDRSGGSGSLGEYIAGASANVPLSNCMALYTLITYMHPSAGPGGAGSTEDEWSFVIGVAIYPGRNAVSKTVAGQCWMPLMPVAQNGYFMVDTNHH